MNAKEARGFEHLFAVSKDFESIETLPEKTARARGYLDCLAKAEKLAEALRQYADTRAPLSQTFSQAAQEALALWEKEK